MSFVLHVNVVPPQYLLNIAACMPFGKLHLLHSLKYMHACLLCFVIQLLGQHIYISTLFHNVFMYRPQFLLHLSAFVTFNVSYYLPSSPFISVRSKIEVVRVQDTYTHQCVHIYSITNNNETTLNTLIYICGLFRQCHGECGLGHAESDCPWIIQNSHCNTCVVNCLVHARSARVHRLFC